MREPYKQAFEQKHPGDKALDRADHAARMR
jgi:hypothetical protein